MVDTWRSDDREIRNKIMSNYFFSASENAFYPESLVDVYEAAGTWPADGVMVSEAEYIEFSGEPPSGMIRGSGNDGAPTWVDVPPPTAEELVLSAEAEKQSLIDQANAYMNSKQWPGKAAMGRLSDADKVQYNAWLDYLDALEAVDTSSAPDIEWPIPPEVPAR
jgi:hypothetical protein